MLGIRHIIWLIFLAVIAVPSYQMASAQEATKKRPTKDPIKKVSPHSKSTSQENTANPEKVQTPQSLLGFHVAALSEFPMALGVQGSLRVGSRLLFYLQGGVVPELYVNMADSIAQGLGAYGKETGDLVTDLLPGATYLEIGGRLYVGSKTRWYLEAGLGFLFGKSQSTGKDLLEAILGRSLLGAGTNQIPVEGEVTALKLGMGYSWPWRKRFHWDFGLAILHPIASSTTMDIPWLNGGAIEQALVKELDAFMENTYDQLYLPMITVSFRY